MNPTHHVPDAQASLAKKAVPVLLIFFVFSLIIDNSFKLVSVAIAKDLGISTTTVSWQATLAGLVIGIGAVVYASLADSISIRSLLVAGIGFITAGSVLGFVFQHSFPLVLLSRIIQTAAWPPRRRFMSFMSPNICPKTNKKDFSVTAPAAIRSRWSSDRLRAVSSRPI